MKIFMVLFLGLITIRSTGLFADEIDDIFRGGRNGDEILFDRFDENNVMEAISHDAGIVCKKGLCTINSVSSKFKEVNFEVSGGVADGVSAMGSGGGYFPYFGSPTPVGGDTSGSPFGRSRNLTLEDRANAKVSFTVKVGSCEQKVNVPRSLYYALNKYIYGLLNTDSTTRRSFTPADEAMIIFYTTVSNQAKGCR